MQTILIADDDIETRAIYANALRERGLTVIEASNGEDATLSAISNHIDVLITDVFMPIVDGAALVDVVRLVSPSTKIIVNSIVSIPGQTKMIGEAHAYHDKSDGIDGLMEKVEKHLPKKHSSSKWTPRLLS